jgi:ATP-dependent DNA ligase
MTQQKLTLAVSRYNPLKVHDANTLAIDIVFDIIFYDGKSLINNPLEERINLLNLVIQTQNQHLMLMTRQTMSTMEEVALALDEAVKKQ